MTETARSKAAAYLTVACALAVSAAWLREAGQGSGSAFVDLYEQRYAGLREALPQRGVAGWISDLPEGDINYITDRCLLQYAIAPVILAGDSSHPLVIGSFHTTGGIAAATEGKSLTLVKDFGQGVMLFRR
ncbi:MAG: hypothetical protein HYR60_28835 [Acidobacteria bacterium]|nr:hypothetical protein [Acidobacteriota bacterium]